MASVSEVPLVSVPSVRDDDRRARESPCQMAFSRRGRACLNARVMWNRSGLVQVLLFSGLVQVLLLLVAEFALVCHGANSTRHEDGSGELQWRVHECNTP